MPNDIIGERSTAPQNIVGILRNVGSGRGIASIDLDSGCHLVVTYTDGTTWTSDETLRGITATAVTDEYKLRITYEDGTVWTSPQSIRGPVGPSTDTKVGELEDLTTVEKGTAVGAINELDAKGKKAADSAYQLLSKKTTEDTDPYLFRKTPEGVGDRADDTIVGGTVAWNQLNIYGDFPDSSSIAPTRGTASYSNNILTFSVTEFGNFDYAIRFSCYVTYKQNHKYLCLLKARSSKDYKIVYVVAKNAASILLKGRHDITSSFTDVTDIISPSDSIESSNSNNGFWVGIVPPSDHAVGDTVDFRDFMVIDLTQMFGTSIADYIYSLETETAGAGVAWFKQYFPADYYPYNPGELVSVKPTAKVTRGFNQWDEEWEVGSYSEASGNKFNNNSCIRSTNFIDVFPNTKYYYKIPQSLLFRICYYDSSYNFISSLAATAGNTIYTTPGNCKYITFAMRDTYGTTYNYDICVNMSDDSKNGTYEPYAGRTYPLDAEVRGLISLIDGKLAFNNGDIYTPDGKVKRKYWIVDLGTLNWDYSTRGCFYVRLGDAKERNNHLSNTYANIICNKYPTCTNSQGYNASIDKAISLAYWNAYPYLSVTDTSYGTDAASFKPAMSGVYLVYELAIPTTEQSLPYDSPQVIFPDGTEQYVDDRTVPLIVGHITTYHTDMRNKLESLPDSTLEHWEVGSADQLTTKLGDTDQIPYLYRKSGGDLTVGTREYDTLVGGTVAWNQRVRELSSSDWIFENGVTGTFTDGEVTFVSTVENNGVRQSRTYDTSYVIGDVYLASFYAKTTDPSGNPKIRFISTGNATVAFSSESLTTDYIQYSAIIRASNTTLGAPYVYALPTALNKTISVKRVQCFNLTQMFGSTIAEYVFNLGHVAGTAWFKNFFPKNYYPYDTGSLVSVHPSAHKMVEFNQWDEEWERANVNWTTYIFTPSPTGGRLVSKNYIKVLPNTTYHITPPVNCIVVFYETDSPTTGKNGYVNNTTGLFTTSSTTNYIKFGYDTDQYSTTYNHDICINLHWDGERDGEYEPYEEHEYALDPDLELRGIPKLDTANKLMYDGDIYEPDGKVTRKYGIVDLGTLSWTNGGNLKMFFSTGINGVVRKVSSNSVAANWIICQKFIPISYDAINTDTAGRICISTSGSVGITDWNTYDSVDAFKTAMSGVYLVYELATPTTETSTAFTNPQVVDPDGTEQYIDERTVSVPVGHSTFYPKDLKRKLEELPDPPSGANGTYILKATINNGVTTYSWVVE